MNIYNGFYENLIIITSFPPPPPPPPPPPTILPQTLLVMKTLMCDISLVILQYLAVDTKTEHEESL